MLYKYFFLILTIGVAGCRYQSTAYQQPSNNIPVDSTLVASPKISTLIEPYTQRMAASMNEVIGQSPSFEEKKKPSSPIGSFMADAVMHALKAQKHSADFCLLNYGGIRSSLNQGPITAGDIYKIMPFENEIVVLKMPIIYLDSLIGIIKAKGGEPMSIEYNTIPQIKVAGNTHFLLATNDYMAKGGDNYSLLLLTEEYQITGIKIREALFQYVKAYDVLPIDHNPRTL